MEHTKDRILKEALQLFSQYGYEAVSVVQIADAVGIKAPSLYKHYKSKQDIFHSILLEMEKRYLTQMSAMKMNGTQPDMDASKYEGLSQDHLIAMGKQLFLFYLHDEFNAQFRKMLTIEKYHNADLADLFTQQYMDGPLQYQGHIFKLLLEHKKILNINPSIMALHFYAPLFLLLTRCDSQPAYEKKALEITEQHIKQFCLIYWRGK